MGEPLNQTQAPNIPGILFAIYKPGAGPIRVEWSDKAWALLDRHGDEGEFADRLIAIAQELLDAPRRHHLMRR